MNYQSNSDLLLRRTAFYSNTLYNLQQLVRDVKDHNADKWITDYDTNTINELLGLLRRAELAATTRYQEVLKERAEDLRSSLVVNHDTD